MSFFGQKLFLRKHTTHLNIFTLLPNFVNKINENNVKKKLNQLKDKDYKIALKLKKFIKNLVG